MRVICIIQARENSTRLPGKINMDIGDRTMLWHVETRVNRIKGIDVMVARPEDFPSVDENDVLGRFFHAAAGYEAIMRVTGDCPLLDPAACQEVVEVFGNGRPWDYVALGPTYPDGLGCEIFTQEALTHAHRNAKKDYDREHVTPYIRTRSREFNLLYLRCPLGDHSHLKLSVDTLDDLQRVRAIDAAGPRDYSLAATLEAIERAKAQA